MALQRTEEYVEDQHKYKERHLPTLAERTEHKPLAPYSVNLLQPQVIVQDSPFQDLPVRQPTTQILTNAATHLSSHTMRTQAESIKQAGGKISQFNSALPDALPHSHNITFTSHSPSHRNERHTARSDVFELAKFLARRDLLTGGLSRFNDKPKNYWAWKSSFCNANEGLNL